MVERDAESGETRATELGAEDAAKLIAERRATFAGMLDGWEPERHNEVAGLLTKLAHELAPAKASGLAPG